MGGSIMPADWMALEESFYPKLLMDAVVQSGLYELFCRGDQDLSLLIDEGYDAHGLWALVEALVDLGWLNTTNGHIQWTGPAIQWHTLRQVHQLRQWADLAARLRSPHSKNIAGSHTLSELSALQETASSFIPWVVRTLCPESGERWLELGAGAGALACHLDQRGVRVTAVDTPSVVEQFRHCWPPSISALAIDVFHGPIPNGAYHYISLVRFVDSFAPHVLIDLMRRLLPKLTEDGRLVVVGYAHQMSPGTGLFQVNIFLEHPQNRGRCYTVPQLIAMAAKVGLSLQRLSRHEGYVLLSFKRSRFYRTSTIQWRRKIRRTTRRH